MRLCEFRRSRSDVISEGVFRPSFRINPSRFAELEHHPRSRLCTRPRAAYLMLGDNSPWSRDAACMGASQTGLIPIPANGLGYVWAIKLGGARIACDRQSVLRVLAACQTGLAQDSAGSGFPAAYSSVYRTNAIHSMKIARPISKTGPQRPPKAFVKTGIDATEDRYRLTVTIFLRASSSF